MAQVIAFCLLGIIFGLTLINTAPVKFDDPTIQHERISAIANHLLQELAREQLKSQSSNTEPQTLEDTNEKQLNSNEEDFDYLPTVDELYPIKDVITDDNDDDKVLLETDDTDDVVSSNDALILWSNLQYLPEFNEELFPLILMTTSSDGITRAENDF